MRLHKLDLNLLVALDALLAARSVTVAARKIHVTQPTMSGALSRLRSHFNDPLLVRAGRKLDLTPLGWALHLPVREALDRVEATISMRPTFDPAESRHNFVVCGSSLTLVTLLAPVLRAVEIAAPGVTVDCIEADPAALGDMLLRGEIDFSFVGEPFAAPGHPLELVLEDRFVCIAWTGNRHLRRGLTEKAFLSLGHVSTRYGPNRRAGVEQRAYDDVAAQRRVAVTCVQPVALASLVVGTQRIATVPSRMANIDAATLPLKLYQPPWPLPTLRMVMQWNGKREQDGALTWFRQLVKEVVRRENLLRAGAAEK